MVPSFVPELAVYRLLFMEVTLLCCWCSIAVDIVQEGLSAVMCLHSGVCLCR